MHRANKWFAPVLFALLLIAVTLAIPTAAAQTRGDVAARDQLITEQENLLNAYRCRFGVDTQIVPRGCAEGTPVQPPASPSVFKGTPTAHELRTRDELITSQEELLNVYRCRFGVDTEVVPGQCKPQPQTRPDQEEEQPDWTIWHSADWTSDLGEHYRAAGVVADEVRGRYPANTEKPIMRVQCNPDNTLYIYVWAGGQVFPDDGRGFALVDITIRFDGQPSMAEHGSAPGGQFLHLSELVGPGPHELENLVPILGTIQSLGLRVNHLDQTYWFSFEGFRQYAQPIVSGCGEHETPYSAAFWNHMSSTLSDVGCLMGFNPCS